MRQPEWVLELQEKMKAKRLISILACVGIAFIVMLIAGALDASYGESFNAETGLVAGAIALGALWVFMIPLACLAIGIKCRRYNDHVICIYSGYFKVWLYIDGTLVDEGVGSHELYGQLPTGEEVVVTIKDFGGTRIYIGNAANNQGVHMS